MTISLYDHRLLLPLRQIRTEVTFVTHNGGAGYCLILNIVPMDRLNQGMVLAAWQLIYRLGAGSVRYIIKRAKICTISVVNLL